MTSIDDSSIDKDVECNKHIAAHLLPIKEILSRTILRKHECISIINSTFKGLEDDVLVSNSDFLVFLEHLLSFLFYIRDCRGGCGIRHTFCDIFIAISKYVPNLLAKFVGLIPEYGYYKDYFQILSDLPHADMNPEIIDMLRETIMNVISNQLHEDDTQMSKYLDEQAVSVSKESESVAAPPISLCAKYCPREKKSFAREEKDLFHSLIQKIFPESTLPNAKKQYRQLLSRLSGHLHSPAHTSFEDEANNAATSSTILESPETSNETHHTDDIQVKQLSASQTTEVSKAVCLPVILHDLVRKILKTQHETEKKRMNSLRSDMIRQWQAQQRLQQNRRGSRGGRGRGRGGGGRGGGGRGRSKWGYDETPTSTPAAKKIEEIQLPSILALKEKAGTANKPTASFAKAARSIPKSCILERFQSHWSRLVEVQKRQDKTAAQGINLWNMVGVVDMSGSMAGRPLEVGTALSLFASHVQTVDQLKYRLLTFDTCPRWVSLSRNSTSPSVVVHDDAGADTEAPQEKKKKQKQTIPLAKHIDEMMASSSTSYYCNLPRTLMLLGHMASEGRWRAEQVPDLVIFSDRTIANKHDIFGDDCTEAQLRPVVQYFATIGERMHGSPLPLPRIVYWNLRPSPVTSASRDEKRHKKEKQQQQKDIPSITTLTIAPNIVMDVFTGCYSTAIEYYCGTTEPQQKDSDLSVKDAVPPIAPEAAVSSPPPAIAPTDGLSHHYRSTQKHSNFSWSKLMQSPRYAAIRDTIDQYFVDDFDEKKLSEVRRGVTAGLQYAASGRWDEARMDEVF